MKWASALAGAAIASGLLWDDKLGLFREASAQEKNLKEGLLPACVRTCLGYSLWHGKMSDIEAQKTPPEIYRRPLKDKLPEFADPKLTKPSIRFSENK